MSVVMILFAFILSVVINFFENKVKQTEATKTDRKETETLLFEEAE